MKCPICDIEQLYFEVRNLQFFHWNIAGKYESRRCNHCKAEYVFPFPSGDQIASFYPNDYYAHSPHSESLWSKLIEGLGLDMRTKDPHFDKPGKMLDIGCGTGRALERFKSKGWTVLGINYGNETSNLSEFKNGDIIISDFLALEFHSSLKFDYIRLNHTFEHLPNPEMVLQKIHRLLSPNGKLFIGIPNNRGLYARIFKMQWWNFGMPCHLFLNNPNSLKLLLDRCSFEVESITYNSDYAGLAGSLQICFNYIFYNKTKGNFRYSNNGFIFKNKLFRIFSHIISKFLDFLHLGDCFETIAVKRGDNQWK